ncbi:MAG TPA: outer membrane beta-barrel protein [Fodinibius sp.]|nr:outer membrane beta-barrel protein [Fodinibius sp.]
MKKLLLASCTLIGLLLMLSTSSLAQTHEGRIQIGPGLAYAGDFENVGISVDGYYTINEDFRAGAAFTYYFHKNEVNNYAIDINGNYIFYREEQLMAYGLAGLNVLIWTIDTDLPDGADESGSELGLNLGAGIEYSLDFANLFGELKYAGIGGNADQIVIGAGLRFDI